MRAISVRRRWRRKSASISALFDEFAPWFAAEAISQLQLQQLGFQPKSGVEMFFLDRARADGKMRRGTGNRPGSNRAVRSLVDG